MRLRAGALNNNGYADERRCGVLERDAYVAIKELTAENERLGNIIIEATKREKENLCLIEEIHKQIRELRPLVASVIADTAREILEPIIKALHYTTFASPLEKQSTLEYIYLLKQKYVGGKRNNDD